MQKLTVKDLQEMQSWSLEQKVAHAMNVISSFVYRMGGLDKVYISCSFGKDSCVLLDIARRMYPDILAVYCNTRMEHPSVVKLANEYRNGGGNLLIIRPRMTPREVFAKYGFPLVGKETSFKIHLIRHNPGCASSQKWLQDRLPNGKVNKFVLPHKWRWLIDVPYESHNYCCTILKKEPFRRFEKETGRYPILGMMADESQQRKGLWAKRGGCNVFEGNHKASWPLAIFTEKDIWEYINRYNVKIADVYWQGADRTGCVGCGYGISKEGDCRLKILRDHYPKYYEMIMNYENNGIKYRQALREVLAVDGAYLPDENPFNNLFDL